MNSKAEKEELAAMAIVFMQWIFPSTTQWGFTASRHGARC
jgi:hypothetical protein